MRYEQWDEMGIDWWDGMRKEWKILNEIHMHTTRCDGMGWNNGKRWDEVNTWAGMKSDMRLFCQGETNSRNMRWGQMRQEMLERWFTKWDEIRFNQSVKSQDEIISDTLQDWDAIRLSWYFVLIRGSVWVIDYFLKAASVLMWMCVLGANPKCRGCRSNSSEISPWPTQLWKRETSQRRTWPVPGNRECCRKLSEGMSFLSFRFTPSVRILFRGVFA